MIKSINQSVELFRSKQNSFDVIFFIFLFLIYLFSTSSFTYFIDSPEFTGAAFTLGIPHPPGQPIYIMLAHIFTLLPIGSVSFKVSLFSIVATLSALFFILKTFRIILNRYLKLNFDNFIVYSGILFLALTPACFFQGIRPEVYALHLFFISLAFYFIVLGIPKISLTIISKQSNEAELLTDKKIQLFGVLMFGFALANHHYLTLFAFIPLFVLWFNKKTWKDYIIAGFVLIQGIALYLYLVARAGKPMLFNWLRTSSPSALFDFVSARIFQSSIKTGSVSFFNSSINTLLIVLNNITPLIFILSITGIIIAYILHKTTAVLLLGTMIFNLLTIVLTSADPTNPDAWGYVETGISVFVIFALISLIYFKQKITTKFKFFKTVFIILASFLFIFLSFFPLKKQTLSNFDMSQRLYNASVSTIPIKSIVFPYYYPIHFIFLEKASVENRRPDIAVIHPSFDKKLWNGKFYCRDMKKLHPELTFLIDSFRKTGSFPSDTVLKTSNAFQYYAGLSINPLVPVQSYYFSGTFFHLAMPRMPHPESPESLFVDLFFKHKKTIMRFVEVKQIFTHLFFSSSLILAQNRQFEAAAKQINALIALSGKSIMLESYQELCLKLIKESNNPTLLNKMDSKIIFFRKRFAY